MGYSFYKTIVLIPQGHPLSLANLRERLQDLFAEGIVSLAPRDDTSYIVQIEQSGLSLKLYWEDHPPVLRDSAEIAEKFAPDDEDKQALTSCARRIATRRDDDQLQHAGEFFEMIESIPGLYIFEAEEAALRKTG